MDAGPRPWDENSGRVLTDDETTNLQFAIDANDSKLVAKLVAPHKAKTLSEVQFYGNSTLLMYVFERSTPEVADVLIKKGLTVFELPWSDNNELKAALGNRQHASAMLRAALSVVPEDLLFEMITSDWDPDEERAGQAQSAFQLAEKLPDPICRELLLESLDRLKTQN